MFTQKAELVSASNQTFERTNTEKKELKQCHCLSTMLLLFKKSRMLTRQVAIQLSSAKNKLECQILSSPPHCPQGPTSLLE